MTVPSRAVALGRAGLEGPMRPTLTLRDLKTRPHVSSRLMNVKVPVYVSDAIQRVARDLGASKTEVVVALLNEGLRVSSETLRVLHPINAAGALHYRARRRGKRPPRR